MSPGPGNPAACWPGTNPAASWQPDINLAAPGSPSNPATRQHDNLAAESAGSKQETVGWDTDRVVGLAPGPADFDHVGRGRERTKSVDGSPSSPCGYSCAT